MEYSDNAETRKKQYEQDKLFLTGPHVAMLHTNARPGTTEFLSVTIPYWKEQSNIRRVGERIAEYEKSSEYIRDRTKTDKKNKLPSPENISKITEERKGAIYKIHFKDSRDSYEILPNSLPKCFSRGKITLRWSIFLSALYGETLTAKQKFNVNESFRLLFNDNKFDFFNEAGRFKYLLPISRKAETYEKVNRGKIK